MSSRTYGSVTIKGETIELNDEPQPHNSSTGDVVYVAEVVASDGTEYRISWAVVRDTDDPSARCDWDVYTVREVSGEIVSDTGAVDYSDAERTAYDAEMNRCDRCGHDATANEIALGWPVASDEGEYVCPDCYEAAGDDDCCHCVDCGELLAAVEGAECQQHPDTSDYGLYDSETNDYLGDATAEQVTASLAAGATGIITIDDDGAVVAESDESLATARGATLRTVYASAL